MSVCSGWGICTEDGEGLFGKRIHLSKRVRSVWTLLDRMRTDTGAL